MVQISGIGLNWQKVIVNVTSVVTLRKTFVMTVATIRKNKKLSPYS